mmetsp:Transcript_606/g.731  ORF Transcript_606/g.731 Transcript_606/m.731 type:complete len:93 (+) Transcript_606:237-515(+)
MKKKRIRQQQHSSRKVMREYTVTLKSSLQWRKLWGVLAHLLVLHLHLQSRMKLKVVVVVVVVVIILIMIRVSAEEFYDIRINKILQQLVKKK